MPDTEVTVRSEGRKLHDVQEQSQSPSQRPAQTGEYSSVCACSARGTAPVTNSNSNTPASVNFGSSFSNAVLHFHYTKHLFKSCLFCQHLIQPPLLKLLFLVSEYLLFASEGQEGYH